MSRSTPRPQAARAQRGDRRRDQEVLEVAAQIFYERGYSDATVQEIADALGILKGSLYHYIDTKEDLLFRLLENVHKEVEMIRHEVSGRADLDPLGQLELYVRRTVEYDVRNVVAISVYYHDVERLSEDRRSLIFERRRDHERFVEDLLRAAQERGEADRALDPVVVTNCIFGTIIWLYRWYRPGGGVSEQELGELCARFVRNGLAAIAPAPPGADVQGGAAASAASSGIGA
ncbi:MAG TPA: TetR/AcrR family transcriptional regulator [Solirubrobacteraceae bacterium]